MNGCLTTLAIGMLGTLGIGALGAWTEGKQAVAALFMATAAAFGLFLIIVRKSQE